MDDHRCAFWAQFISRTHKVLHSWPCTGGSGSVHMLTTFGSASGAPGLTGQCKRPKAESERQETNGERQEARSKCKRQKGQRQKTRDKRQFGAWGGVRLLMFGYPTAIPRVSRRYPRDRCSQRAGPLKQPAEGECSSLVQF